MAVVKAIWRRIGLVIKAQDAKEKNRNHWRAVPFKGIIRHSVFYWRGDLPIPPLKRRGDLLNEKRRMLGDLSCIGKGHFVAASR